MRAAQAQRLLSQALTHVPNHGWSTKALALAARDLGLSPIAAGVASNGPVDLVHYFMETANKQTIESLAEHTDPEKSTTRTDVVRSAIRSRLERTLPYLDRWPQAMALGALPPNCLQTGRILHGFIDDVAHHANDQTVGMDWYISRTALASVYVSTELFLLTDRSEGQAGTWQFLDDRLGDMSGLTLVPHQMWQYAQTANSLVLNSFGRLGSAFGAK